jgi:hypothetical protein
MGRHKPVHMTFFACFQINSRFEAQRAIFHTVSAKTHIIIEHFFPTMKTATLFLAIVAV